jgi:outer membrane protein
MRFARALLVVASWVGGVGLAHAEPARVGLDEALSAAARSHPEIVRARALLAAGDKRVDILGTALRPQVSADASLFVGASPPLELWEPRAGADVGVSLGWTLIDFGRTRAAERAARRSIEASRDEIAVLERDIALGVEEAFYQALAAHELVSVAVVGFEAEARHRAEAERFVAAGQRAAIEVARARTQEARARTEVVRAEAAARLALVYLARAMGVSEVPAGVDGGWPARAEGEVAGAVEAALGQRAEVKVAKARVAASELEAEAAERGVAPIFSANARVGVGSRDLEVWDPTWVAGVNLSWPFLDGGRSSAQAEAARADARAAEVVIDQLGYVIAAEVQAQQVALLSATAEVDAASAAREAAEVELRLAEARWKEGLGSGIELADAQARLTATDAERTRAELSRALAKARFRRSLGAVP